ncbi:hypothetical protein STEG23_021197, partial [Scotinomys teguina]
YFVFPYEFLDYFILFLLGGILRTVFKMIENSPSLTLMLSLFMPNYKPISFIINNENKPQQPPLLKTTPTQLIEQGEFDLVPVP